MNVPVDVVNVWPIVAPGHERVGVRHAAAGVELEPVVAFGLGQELRVVRRVGDLRAGRDVADRLIAGREHRQDQGAGPGSARASPETYCAGMPEARIKATPRLATSSALPALDQSVPVRRAPSPGMSCSRSGCAGS